MISKSLKECKMFKLLNKRKDNSIANVFSGLLLVMESQVGELLEYIKYNICSVRN